MNSDIGTIATDTWEATLGGDGIWRATVPTVGRWLNVRHSPADYTSEADGWPLWRAFHAAADDFQARIVRVAPLPPPPPGSLDAEAADPGSGLRAELAARVGARSGDVFRGAGP